MMIKVTITKMIIEPVLSLAILDHPGDVGADVNCHVLSLITRVLHTNKNEIRMCKEIILKVH